MHVHLYILHIELSHGINKCKIINVQSVVIKQQVKER